MSEFNNDSKQYTASEIRQYLNGKMSADEMHAIEKAALEDPFLADAIEGFQEAKKEFSNNTITANLDQLHQQISAKATGGKVVPITSFPWLRMAVAASVLVVVSVMAYNTWLKPDRSQAIAVNDTKINAPETVSPAAPDNSIVQRDSSKEDMVSISEERKLPASTVEKEEQKKSGNNEPANALGPEKNDPGSSLAGKGKEAETAATKDVVKTDDKNKEILIDSESARSKQVAKQDQAIPGKVSNNDLAIVNEPAKNVTRNPAAASSNPSLNYFNGRIIDNNNRPVAHATVQLANTKKGYLTDQYGNFRVPGEDTMVEVTVTGVGYASRNFRLRNDVAINQLQLQPDDKSLNEVVVVTKDQKKSKEKTNYKTKFPSVLVQDAEPANGWKEFEIYIKANKKTIINDSATSGEVVVSFLVKQNAALSGFKIEQSLSPAHDAEAIRLIKEGPSWHLLKGKKASIFVIIRF